MKPWTHNSRNSCDPRSIPKSPAVQDGERFFVDRLWPRGKKKAALALTDWLKEAAPSHDLRKWFGHDSNRWQKFRQEAIYAGSPYKTRQTRHTTSSMTHRSFDSLTVRSIVVAAIFILMPGLARAQTALTLVTNQGARLIFKAQPRDGAYPGDHKITVILPPGYESSSRRYPVLYSFDTLDLSRERDALIRERFIEPIILVAVDNRTPRSRRYDLTPTQIPGISEPTGGLSNFMKVLIHDIKPHIDAHFRTLPDASNTGVTGFSLGGLASFLIGTQHPEIFGRIGAMEPAVWWGGSWASVENFRDRPFKAQKPRIWIMGSELDSANAWKAIRLTAATFLQKGWVEGDELVFYQVHNMTHGWASCATQIRDMLYFLFRTKKPELVDARLNITHGDQNKPLRLWETGEYANLCLDLFYRGGFRATAIAPALISSDPKIVAVGNPALGQLWPQGNGWATVSSKYKGVRSSLDVEGFEWRDHPRFPIVSNDTDVRVDGDLAEWTKLPFSSTRGRDHSASTNGFEFSVSMNASNLYVAVQVKDTFLSFQPTLGEKFHQDGLEITVDPRPDPVRSMGRGYEKYFDFICIRLAPSETTAEVILSRYDQFLPPVPVGVDVAIGKREAGYSVEISMPLRLLQSIYRDAPKGFHWNGYKPGSDESQSADWERFRLNIGQYDKDREGKIQEIWWQPPWDGPNNFPGSGTFTR
ncbi:MAG TPA: alpha/beta hydrolase-fold protein [Verrucomicrobiae bacterium]|nr:alpha/beta hydrolase-fold protein [Verrucomicrobiae bacterium]